MWHNSLPAPLCLNRLCIKIGEEKEREAEAQNTKTFRSATFLPKTFRTKCLKLFLATNLKSTCSPLATMGNHLEKSEQFWHHPENGKWSGKMWMVYFRFFCYTRNKFSDEPKNFRVAMLPCYPGFCTSGRGRGRGVHNLNYYQIILKTSFIQSCFCSLPSLSTISLGENRWISNIGDKAFQVRYL